MVINLKNNWNLKEENSNDMLINTVTGEKNLDELGYILPHEHILIDMQKTLYKIASLDKTTKVSCANRYQLFSEPYALIDNALLDDVRIAINELKLFKQFGGDTIVDCTLYDIGRNVKKLNEISLQSGINIICGCGYYYESFHSKNLTEVSINKIADEIISDLTVGINNSNIKAGVIGEIGTSAEITKNEWKCLEASGIASCNTRRPIHIHTALWKKNGIEIAKKLLGLKVNPKNICIDHVDVLLDFDYLLELLNMGVMIEFDNFGKEFMVTKNTKILDGDFASDSKRLECLSKLINLGYEDNILLTNDICLKSMLTYYGGNGYSHIKNNIEPLLERFLDKKTIIKLLYSNPKDFLKSK